MAEAVQPMGQPISARTGPPDEMRRQSPLHTEMGVTHIEDSVVTKIAGMAAQEIDGIRMGGGASRTFGGIVDQVTGSSGGQSRGVSVEVGEYEAAVDLTLAVQYGKNIPQLADRVRRNITERIENLVGLKVTEVNITVDDVYFEGERAAERPGEPESREVRVR